ncbi:MAG: hypothetical protein E7176_05285 [Erysipelotrichaceae bacterium]|nr:hypothetical protein [Erysipelotrichaceae bacterium]
MRYLEIIILINLAIHLSFIMVANYIFKQKKNRLMIFLSCILDIIYILMYVYIPYILEPYRFVFIFIISILPFVTKGLIKALMLLLVYLLLNFTLGGSAGILYKIINNFYVVLISLFIILLIISICSLYKKTHSYNSSFIYPVFISDGIHSFYLDGYCDTGNFLTTDENIPIVFLNRKISIGRYKRNIIVTTVSTKKEIMLYEVKEFKIKIKNKYVKRDVYIAYADISHMVMFGLNILGG